MSRPLSADEAALVARGLAEFRDAHRWERLGHKYLPHRCALSAPALALALVIIYASPVLHYPPPCCS